MAIIKVSGETFSAFQWNSKDIIIRIESLTELFTYYNIVSKSDTIQNILINFEKNIQQKNLKHMHIFFILEFFARKFIVMNDTMVKTKTFFVCRVKKK